MDCKHCGRRIVKEGDAWIDPEAPLDTDDAIWRETCDANDTFTAEHEPATGVITDFANVFGAIDFAHEAGRHFTCTEANAVARLLVALEHPSEAVSWLLGHAENDDEHDLHHHVQVRYDAQGNGDVDAARQRVRDYVEEEL